MLTSNNHHIIGTYYNSIRKLIIQLRTTELTNTSKEEKEQLINKLSNIYNKLILTNIMGKKSLLAITGLQGAGKTTLIKNLYDLPSNLLPSNSSRGERIPVFITEKPVTEIAFYVYEVQDEKNMQLSVSPKDIDIEQFNSISLNPSPKNHLWLECVVPQRYLNDDMKSIVLLPGFESDQADISQLLLEHLLYLSTSSVLVLRKDTYARETTQAMMYRVKEIYKSVKPIIAISFGNVEQDKNTDFRNDIIAEFNIPEEEESRVVVTGIGPDFSAMWKDTLVETINNFAYSSITTEDREQLLLFQLIDEIDTITNEIRKIMDMEAKSRNLENSDNATVESVMFLYESASNKFLNDLEKEIAESLRRRIGPSTDTLIDYLDKTSDWKKEIKTKFFGPNIKESSAFEKKLEKIWNNPNEHIEIIEANQEKPKQFLPPNVEVLQIVSNFIAREGQHVIEAMEEKTEEGASKKLNALQAQMLKLSGVKEKKVENPLARIDDFFIKEHDKPFALQYTDYKTLAVMGTMLLRESYIEELPRHEAETALNPDLLQKAEVTIDPIKGVEKLSTVAPKVLKSIPIILGADALIDGELDLVSNAATALTAIGLKVSAAQLLGVLGIGFATAYAGKVVQESIVRSNERQLQLLQAGKQVFNELPQLQAKAFVQALKKVYDRMGEQLYERHLQLSGQFDKIGEIEQINYNLRRISQLTNDIKRTKYEKSVFLPL